MANVDKNIASYFICDRFPDDITNKFYTQAIQN